MTNPSIDIESSNTGWKAQLDLSFIQDNHRTIIQDRKHFGPLQIQKPFYPEADGTCHVYILHPPGGVVGGDRFEIRIHVQSCAKALITTPAAGKFYRSAGPVAEQYQEIKVDAHSCLEWFPSENIFFSGGRANIKTKVLLTDDSQFIGWDISCLGRPACGERFSQGSLDQRFELWIQDNPVCLERLLIKENDLLLDANWGLAEKPVVGNLVCLTSRKDLVDLLRHNILSPEKRDFFSVTFVNGVILCRYLGNSVEQAKQIFIQAWHLLRIELRGYPATIPRIWNT